jgi:magnesium transporter
MGDVQDHILTLQQSLHHYERMLSDSRPAYLTQLRTHLAKTKQYTDKAILVLSLISIGVMCIQIPIGMLPAVLQCHAYLLLFHRIIFIKPQDSEE